MATETQWLQKWCSTAEERERCALRVGAEVCEGWCHIKHSVLFLLKAPNEKVLCTAEKLSASSQVRLAGMGVWVHCLLGGKCVA